MHRHTKAVCEIIRFRAEVVCVLCGSRCDLLGLKEPGDIETASLQRGLLRGVNFPDRLSVSHLCVCVCASAGCVLPCLLFISTISQFHLCYFHPLSVHSSPPPPSLCSTERATDPLGGQINSPARAAPSAEAAALKLALWLLYLTSHNALYHTHTPPAFTHRICTEYKAPEQFFPFTLPIPTRPPLSEVAANLSGGGVSGRIVSLWFNQ